MIRTPWLAHYPSGVPHTIDPARYVSLVHLMQEIFARYSRLPMCESMGKVLTFGKMDQLSRAFAAYIQQHTSLLPGMHVAIQLPNLLQYPIAVLGILRAGCVVVNVNPQYTPHEMAHQLKDSNARAVVILENFAYKLVDVLSETAVQTVIVAKVGDALGSFKGGLLNFFLKRVKKLVPPYRLPQAVSFKEVVARGKKALYRSVDLTPSDTAFLQYTGGTTGISKGAVLSHGNVLANLQQLDPVMRLGLQEKVERVVVPLPLYHILGLAGLFAMAQIGARVLLIANPRDIPRFVKALHNYKPTCLIGIQTLFEKLLANDKFGQIDLSSLKLTIAGGMKTQPEVRATWEQRTGSKLVEGYGLTECAPVVSTDMIDGLHHMPLPGTLVIVADESGNEMPYGTVGELLVKGPQVTQAYWLKPLETEQAFLNGWFKTGDLAVMDSNGFITVVDRKKDMINISGFNVYPNEIEQVLSGHPKVLEVGAIGIEDLRFREAIKVCIVKKDATLTAEEIIAYCKEKLTRYKIPKYVEFRNSLPKSPIGKVLRRLLKDS